MAAAGTTVAFIMSSMMGLTSDLGEDRIISAVFVAIMACTIVQGWGFGGAFGVRIARGANPWLSGVQLAFLTVVGTVLLMSIGIAVVLLVAGRGLSSDHAMATLVWTGYVLLFGAVPLVALGLGYGAMLRGLKQPT